ncbi:hypothetical protein AN476_15585 [Phaeobacter sp. 11ANDIMAR09]|nr:hypothetical protein AN476_15585 [Phaeobacter sp. 11ANDIMAR09]
MIVAILCRVFVDFDFVVDSNNFFAVIVAAGGAHVMGTLQLTAVRAFVRVCSNQSVVRAAVVTARLGYFILLDGHVSTFVYWGLGVDARGAFHIRSLDR